jgi:hypothetical protein
LDAEILSRMRSEVTSRSNWANDSSNVQGQPAHRDCGVELLGHQPEQLIIQLSDLKGGVGSRLLAIASLCFGKDHKDELRGPADRPHLR